MKLVRFLRPHKAYNGGETAGFSDEQADQLVAAGLAEPVSAEPPTGLPVEQPVEQPAEQPAPEPATEVETPETDEAGAEEAEDSTDEPRKPRGRSRRG